MSSAKQQKLIVTATPHVRDHVTTEGIMKDVILALLPAGIMGVYYFGVDALITIAACVASCVFFEWAFQKYMKRDITIGDFSAALTGLLLAYNLPASKNIGLAVVGSFFAIIVVKQLFGGIGHNFLNPALGARAFLLLSYSGPMTNFKEPVRNLFNMGVDAVSTATPLFLLKEGIRPETSDYINAFIGYSKGCIGETCAIALILGGLYLLFKKIIDWKIPLSFIITVYLMSWIFGRFGMFNGAPVLELLTGGLLLGAIFMATDYTTSPVTPVGHLVMGIGCGIITVVIRRFGSYPEGVSYSILFMNLAVPLIDHYTRPRVFGAKKKAKEGKA